MLSKNGRGPFKWMGKRTKTVTNVVGLGKAAEVDPEGLKRIGRPAAAAGKHMIQGKGN